MTCKTRQRIAVTGGIEEIVSKIHAMNKNSVDIVVRDFSAMNDHNCAWFEYAVRDFVLEVCRDRLEFIASQKRIRQQRKAQS